MSKRIFSFPLLSVSVAILIACGGGGGNSSTQDVSKVANANLAALGASTISNDANVESFDVVASIGDTWRFVVNKATGAYTVTPNNSQYSLTAETGTLTRTVSGNFVSYTLANKLSLTMDSRTSTLSGLMTVGAQTASVAGTPYQVASASALAGKYNFMGTTRDKVGGANAEFFAGQLLVAANGTTVKLCLGGQIDDNGNCVQVDPAKTPEPASLNISKNNNANGGFFKLSGLGPDNVQHDWGNLMVGNGDLGTTLLIDRFGYNNNGVGSTPRVGSFYAVKVQTLASNAFNGSWSCKTPSGTATLDVDGTRNTITNPDETPSTWIEYLSYNNVNSVANTKIPFPGFATSEVQGEASSAVLVLPLSSSLAAVELQSINGVVVCSKQP